jgi:hypothetical protein
MQELEELAQSIEELIARKQISSGQALDQRVVELELENQKLREKIQTAYQYIEAFLRQHQVPENE